MNDEQIERRIEFIVEQQAQFVVDIQQIKERQEAEAKLWREKHESLRDAMTAVVGIVGRVAKAQERTEEKLTELTNKQAETDDRLNVLVGVVERYFSGNGQSPKRKSHSSKASAKRPQTKSSRKK